MVVYGEILYLRALKLHSKARIAHDKTFARVRSNEVAQIP